MMRIGIEINGNQHYERNGKLKKYYQDRHDHIELDNTSDLIEYLYSQDC